MKNLIFNSIYMFQMLNVRTILAVVHLSNLTIQRRLALSLHKDDTLYKEIYHFFWKLRTLELEMNESKFEI